MPGSDYEVEPEHIPMRGDAVETWLKAQRDRYPRTPWYAAIDELLDEYRLRADTGLTLADDIADATEFREHKQSVMERLEELRLEFQRRRDRPPPPFRDEGRNYLTRSGRRAQPVVTARIPCPCIHDVTTGQCQEHQLALKPDFSCDCPKPL